MDYTDPTDNIVKKLSADEVAEIFALQKFFLHVVQQAGKTHLEGAEFDALTYKQFSNFLLSGGETTELLPWNEIDCSEKSTTINNNDDHDDENAVVLTDGSYSSGVLSCLNITGKYLKR